MEDGTGVVHIAPAFGDEDLNLAREKGLAFVQPVDLQGRITGAYPFSGKFVKDADADIMEDLQQRGWKRYEELRPDELAELVQRTPVAFWPLGLIEHHGWHLPVGYDGLKAEQLCRRIATRTGGVILPVMWGGARRWPRPFPLDPLPGPGRHGGGAHYYGSAAAAIRLPRPPLGRRSLPLAGPA